MSLRCGTVTVADDLQDDAPGAGERGMYSFRPPAEDRAVAADVLERAQLIERDAVIMISQPQAVTDVILEAGAAVS